MKIIHAVLAAVLSAAFAPPVAAEPAHSLAGDWHGDLKLPLTLRVSLHVTEASDGSLAAATTTEAGVGWASDWTVTQSGDSVKLSTPTGNGQRIEMAWDQAAGAWTGKFYNTSGVFPIALFPGPLPPPPKVDGLDGDWSGTLSAQGLSLRVVLRVKTENGSTAAFLDSPDQPAYSIRVSSLKCDQARVSFEIPTIGLTYAATLSADHKTITGEAGALGVTAPLVLSRQ